MRARDWLLLPASFVVSVGGTIVGGHNSYVAVRNPAPLEITCADYLRDRPAAAWLRLTHCAPDFDHLGIETLQREANPRTGAGPGPSTTSAVWIPLRAEGTSRARLTRLLLLDESGELEAPHGGDSEHAEAVYALGLARGVEGLVQGALDLDQHHRLAELELPLTADFVVVARGAEPRPLWLAFGELALGLAGLGWLVRRYRRRRRPVQPPRARIVRERGRATDDAQRDT